MAGRAGTGQSYGFRFLQYYAVRTEGHPASVISSVRGVLRQIDEQAALYNVAPMEQLVSNSISRPRLYAVLVAVFGGAALALAAVGIYDVVSYALTQRMREIGIRVALGASRSDVLGLVLRQSILLTTAGLVLGLSGAAALTGYLEGMLYGLKPLDPLTFLAVSLIFGLVANLASYVPARRALKVVR
ncbi:MAG: FtsX-like permease family protein [Acidobacteriota bacterium]